MQTLFSFKNLIVVAGRLVVKKIIIYNSKVLNQKSNFSTVKFSATSLKISFKTFVSALV